MEGKEGEDGLEQRELIRLRATGDGSSHHSKNEATTRNSDDWGGGFVTHNPACNPHMVPVLVQCLHMVHLTRYCYNVT